MVAEDRLEETFESFICSLCCMIRSRGASNSQSAADSESLLMQTQASQRSESGQHSTFLGTKCNNMERIRATDILFFLRIFLASGGFG